MEIGLDDYVAGAATVTDLLNTRAGFTAGDRLTTRAELAAFCREHEIAGPVRPDDLAAVRERRDRLVALVEAGASGASTAALLDGLHRVLDAVPYDLRLRPGEPARWVAVTRGRAPAGDALTLLTAVSLLAVARHLGPERLRACGSEVCNGLFVDTSSNGRRRFCTPARCGSRTRVADLRARRRAQRPTGEGTSP